MKNIFKNKKVRIFSLATMLSSMISTGIFIQSCSNETEVLTLDIPEEYNEVGKLHNEGLEYVFTQIKAQAIESVKNPDIKSLSVKVNNQEFIKQVTIDFCEKNKRLKNSFGVYEQAIENVLNPRMALKSTALENVSPSLKTLQDAVTAAIRKEYKKEELSQLKFQLDEINRKATEILPEEEAIQMYCMTSTAYSSYQYWMENYKKWYFALNYPEILEQYNDAQLNQMKIKSVALRSGWSNLWNTVEDWWHTVSNAVDWWWDNGGSDIVIADAAGGGAGAVTGAITGAGAIPGAIAGGLAGSVKSAVEHYLDDWWN